MDKRWNILAADTATVQTLQDSLKIHPILCELLVQRGIDSFDAAKKFFRPQLEHLHDPWLMKDMGKAVDRIEKAVVNKESILVFGDYDVDGTTSVATLYQFLKKLTEQVDYYIPHRYKEGYGVSKIGIDYAKQTGIQLIISVDCGIKSIELVEYAKELGIDFIICDHHLPDAILPPAIAILNPKQIDCNYPFKELCGCGVVLKLITALADKYKLPAESYLEYLDLVATAIAADIVPIVDENRTLAYFGLQQVNESPCPGLLALMELAKQTTPMRITNLVFAVAPRINAAGRMKHGNHAVTLLTEIDFNLAAEHALDIDQYNTDRRETDKRITEEALVQIEENSEQERFSTVVYDENWHKGVIGIVASRLIETYYRPTLVFTKSGNKLAASARSVKGFDVYNALEACSEFIEQFGGHKYAAGLTLLPENYEAFKTKFESFVKESIDPKLLTPELKIDSEINLNEIDHRLYRILSQFAPFGPGNMTPVFMTQAIKDTGWGKCVGEDDKHLRFTATQKANEKLVCIGFGLGDKLDIIKDKKSFNVVYTIDENRWNGNISLQLKLKDIKA